MRKISFLLFTLYYTAFLLPTFSICQPNDETKTQVRRESLFVEKPLSLNMPATTISTILPTTIGKVTRTMFKKHKTFKEQLERQKKRGLAAQVIQRTYKGYNARKEVLSPKKTGGSNSISVDPPPSQNSSSSVHFLPSPPALFNPTATMCYMNASCQTLFNLPELTDALKKQSDSNDFLKKLSAIHSPLHPNTHPSIQDMKDLHEAQCNVFNYSPKQQQDATEFVDNTLSLLFPHNQQDHFSTIETIYQGKKQNSEEFADLLHQGNPKTIQWISPRATRDNLQDILTTKIQGQQEKTLMPTSDEQYVNFIEASPLEMENEYTFKPGNWQQYYQVKNHKKFLLMGINKFDSQGNKKRIDMHIPMKLDLDSHTYTLVGTINHHGQRATSGHYTAYIKKHALSNSPQWYHCNDATITPVRENTIQEKMNSEAYVLFYQHI